MLWCERECFCWACHTEPNPSLSARAYTIKSLTHRAHSVSCLPYSCSFLQRRCERRVKDVEAAFKGFAEIVPLAIVLLGLFPSPEHCVYHFAQEKHCASLLGTGSGLLLLQVSLQTQSTRSAFCKPYPMHLYSLVKKQPMFPIMLLQALTFHLGCIAL